MSSSSSADAIPVPVPDAAAPVTTDATEATDAGAAARSDAAARAAIESTNQSEALLAIRYLVVNKKISKDEALALVNARRPIKLSRSTIFLATDLADIALIDSLADKIDLLGDEDRELTAVYRQSLLLGSVLYGTEASLAYCLERYGADHIPWSRLAAAKVPQPERVLQAVCHASFKTNQVVSQLVLAAWKEGGPTIIKAVAQAEKLTPEMARAVVRTFEVNGSNGSTYLDNGSVLAILESFLEENGGGEVVAKVGRVLIEPWQTLVVPKGLVARVTNASSANFTRLGFLGASRYEGGKEMGEGKWLRESVGARLEVMVTSS